MLALYNIALLLISLQLYSPVEEQIHKYYSSIESGTDISESIWSLIRYSRENETFREIVIDVGREYDQTWSGLLADNSENQDIYQSIHDISMRFEDPRLQIYLQFTLSDSTRRKEYYDIFMSHSNQESLLANLLTDIHLGNPLSSHYFLDKEWDFYHFLLFQYYDYITFEDPDLPLEYANFLYENLESFHRIGSDLDISYYNATIATALYLNGNIREIDAYYHSIIDFELVPNLSFKRDLYWGIENIFYVLGKIDRSLYIHRAYTIPLTELLGDRVTLNTILSNHGAYLIRIGKYEEARRVLNQALQDTNNLTANTQTLLLNNLSLTQYKLGDTNKYLDTQFRALNFANEQNNLSYQLNIYRNLHVYHRKNRNWESANEYINEARVIAERWGDDTELASVILSQAVFAYDFVGNTEQAFQLLNEAEQLLSVDENDRLVIRLLFERALILKETREFEQSTNIYLQAAEMGLQNSDNVSYIEAMINLAEIELSQGNISVSRDYIQLLRAHDLSVIDFPFLVQARTVEAKLAIQEGRYREANDILSYVSQQVLERSMNTTDPEAGYWHVEDTYLEMFQTYANFLNQQGKSEKVIALLDQLKMINDASLYDNPLVRSASLSEEQLAQYQLISEQMDELRKELLVTSDNDERFQLQNEISALSAQLRQFSLRENQMANPDNFKIWPVQARLKSNQAVLHLTRILDTLYLITIRENEITVHTKPLAEDQEQLFEAAITGISSSNTDLNLLHEIYNYLELDELPSKITSLIVVPDSYLYQLPLDVLPTEQPAQAFSYGSARYLIEDMEISYLNNLNEFLKESPKPFYALDFAGFGISEFSSLNSDRNLVPLPGAPLEVAEIENQLNRFKSTESYIESEATPQHFLSQASRSRILHLATHSTISENDPLFSRLYLYPDSRDNDTPDELSGQVFAYQLFNQNLNNELIMLNSCDSGSGRYFQGSGIMGISRALRYAGAHSLVLNSWAVNDQFASDFAIEFYTHINDGDSKSQALREAKLHFLRNKNANPHYWGPYMLNGDTDPMVHKRGTMETTALLLIFTLVGAWISHKRNRVAMT